MPDDPLRDEFTGAQLVVRVRATHIFPNCPRYIHRMQLAEASPYVPRPGVEPPVPAWKRFEMFSDVLPREDCGGSGSEKRQAVSRAAHVMTTQAGAATPRSAQACRLLAVFARCYGDEGLDCRPVGDCPQCLDLANQAFTPSCSPTARYRRSSFGQWSNTVVGT